MSEEEIIKDYERFKENIIYKLYKTKKYTPEEKMYLGKIDADFQYLQQEKQDLISFIEDELNYYEKFCEDVSIDNTMYIGRVNAYKEILDKYKR